MSQREVSISQTRAMQAYVYRARVATTQSREAKSLPLLLVVKQRLFLAIRLCAELQWEP
jgi:hypothetical protein